MGPIHLSTVTENSVQQAIDLTIVCSILSNFSVFVIFIRFLLILFCWMMLWLAIDSIKKNSWFVGYFVDAQSVNYKTAFKNPTCCVNICVCETSHNPKELKVFLCTTIFSSDGNRMQSQHQISWKTLHWKKTQDKLKTIYLLNEHKNWISINYCRYFYVFKWGKKTAKRKLVWLFSKGSSHMCVRGLCDTANIQSGSVQS